MDERTEISQRVADALRARGITQEEAAILADTDRRKWGAFERNERRIGDKWITYLEQAAKMLNVEPWELMAPPEMLAAWEALRPLRQLEPTKPEPPPKRRGHPVQRRRASSDDPA